MFFPLVTAIILFCSAAHADGPRVLILNSYHQGYLWSDREISGVLEVLHSKYPAIDISIENMDTKRFPGKDQELRLKGYLADKYRNSRPDLIIALDNPALDILLKYRSGIFGDVPVVFAGINAFHPAMISGQSKITGVAEVLAVKANIDLMLSVHPRAREIVIVNDYTATGQAVRHEIEEVSPSYSGRVKISFLPPTTFENAAASLKSLPRDTLALIPTFTTDSSGKTFPLSESTRLLTSKSAVPVYAVHETRLGHGIVGGVLLEGVQHGKKAGLLALKILSGMDASAIPVYTDGTAIPMFDYNMLRKYDISLNRLPSGSVIINRPVPFYEKHRSMLTISILTFLAMSLVILVLLVNIRRRKSAELAVQQSEERFRGAFETAAIGMTIVSLEGKWLKVNQSMCKIVGYSEQELLKMTFRDITHPDDLQVNLAFVKALLAGDIPYYHMEKRYSHKQGHIIWVLLSTSLVRDTQGKPAYYVNLIEDITQRKKAEDELRRNEAKYRSLVESTDDSITLVDRNCRFLFVNEKYLSRICMRKDMVLGKAYTEFYPPDEAAKFVELVDTTFKSGRSVSYEHRSHRDGRYFLRTLSPVKESGGGTAAVTVISKDITDLKLAVQDREKLIFELRDTLSELEAALSEVKKLSGLLPMCASCKKIRDDSGYWKQIESYISENSEADFTHAVCPDCAKKLYPEFYKEVWGKEEDKS